MRRGIICANKPNLEEAEKSEYEDTLGEGVKGKRSG